MKAFESYFELISNKPFGSINDTIIIDGENYNIALIWKRKLKIKIKRGLPIVLITGKSEIKKSKLISTVSRYPQYSISGKRTALTEKLLSNKYTPALLHFPFSRLGIENNQISYSAIIKVKNKKQLEKIIKYFEALIVTIE
ncbi:hypothetical protein [Aequorivita sp. Q41]|uniref:hypothetical protein n=1 Tax=Aequorivita sp. Q41 TaxID=3153300 RepID=UPI0032427B04